MGSILSVFVVYDLELVSPFQDDAYEGIWVSLAYWYERGSRVSAS